MNLNGQYLEAEILTDTTSVLFMLMVKKVSFCNGGGYDMQGTVFGDWIEKEFQNEIKKLDPDKYYGMRVYDNKVIIDGACGFSSVESIVKALGYKVRFEQSTSINRQLVLMIKEN